MKASVRSIAAILLCLLSASNDFAAESSAPRIQLQIEHEPHVARIDGRRVMAYEVHVQSFSAADLAIERVAVLNTRADALAMSLVGPDLAMAWRPEAASSPPTPMLAAGGRAVVYLWLALDPQQPMPSSLLTSIRVSAHESNAEFDILVDVSPDQAPVLGPPLSGGPWVAVYDPSLDRGHRRVFHSEDGAARIPGRHAIDWFKVDATGHMFDGDRDELKHWFGYGADVLAVADGTVVVAVDGRPDGDLKTSSTRRDPTQGSGNHIVLDLGGGRFAFYEHLKPGSLRVRQGDRVRQGAIIAALGNSGDTAGPHLHFHVADAKSTLDAEGLPFAIARFEQIGRYPTIKQAFANEPWKSARPVVVRSELPAPNAVVTFGR